MIFQTKLSESKVNKHFCSIPQQYGSNVLQSQGRLQDFSREGANLGVGGGGANTVDSIHWLARVSYFIYSWGITKLKRVVGKNQDFIGA